jgi:phosphonatase-like hydrolase
MLSDKISLVVLDMMGTTIVDKGEIDKCMQDACQQNGLNVGLPQIKSMAGWSKMNVLQTLWRKKLGAEHPDLDDKVEETYYSFCDMLEAFLDSAEFEPTEGAEDTISWLRDNGVKVALTTGLHREAADVILENLGWDEGLDADHVSIGQSVVDMTICSDEVVKGRPQPFLILKAMKQFAITDSKKVINIGDSQVDISTGKNAKCLMSLAVTNGAQGEDVLRRLEHDGLLPTLGHLKPFLAKAFK